MSPVITQVVFDLIHQEQTDEAIEANKPYLWSRSKCWMRAGKRTFNAPRLKSQIWLIGFNGFWLWQDFDELESMYRGFEGERGSHLYLTCNKPILQIFKDRSGKR